MPSSRRLANLHCITCGYLLRGLRKSSRCPECGTPIRASLPPRHADEPPQHSMILLYVGVGYFVLNVVAGAAASGEVLDTFVVLNPLLLAGAAAMAQKVNDPQPFSWRAMRWFVVFLLGSGFASGIAAGWHG